MMATQATVAEPSRNSTSALVNLVTRAKLRQEASPADAGHRSPPALELWSGRIGAPDSSDEEASQALRQLIQRVQSVTFSDTGPVQPSAPPAQTTSVESVAVAPAPTPTVARVEPVPPAAPQTDAAPSAAPELSPQAQKTFESLRQNPGRVSDPMEAADLLFLSGRPTDAIPFYQELLRRIGTDAASGGDRAWALFQLGNCLRETDAAQAQEVYGKLVAEYPESPWAEMARAGSRLLTWHQGARLDPVTKPRKP